MTTTGDVLRATVKGNLFSADVANMVFHYLVTAGTETDHQLIADNIIAALIIAFAGMESRIADDVLMDEMDLFEYDFVLSEFNGIASAVGDVLAGVNAASMEPNGISIVMRWPTVALRRQARKFVPGVIEADVTDNALAALILTPALATAALLNSTIIAGGVTMRACTFNTTASSPRFETASVFGSVAIVNTLVGYQRRRQPGAGA